MKGSEAIIRTLLEEKTKHIFGFPGGAVLPLYDEFLNFKKELRHILVRHEQGAAHAADAYARVSGGAGVCVATSGPGATNLVTGIMNAFMDSSPVIAFGGQVPTALIGNDAFQESDMMGITMPITKHSFQIRDANKIRATIKKAFTIALNGRPWPVYIDLPKDTQSNEVTHEDKDTRIPGFKPVTSGHPVQIKRAAEMILASERPVIIAGGGVLWSCAAKELAELSEGLNIPVTTTLMGKSCFPEQHPLCLGVLGMHGRKCANHTVANSDLIIAVGCRFSDRITGSVASFAKGSRIIHIDIDSAEIGKNVRIDLPIVGDAKNVLQQMNEALRSAAKKKNTAWAEKVALFIKECDCDIDIKGSRIDPRKLVFELNKALAENDIVVTGVGQQQMFCMHFLKRSRPRTFISSGGAGTMGFGLPAAIGAKVAAPGVDVFDFDGDGSFAMTIQELATSKEEGIKVLPLIMNNAYLGMVRQWAELFFDKRYSGVHLKRTPDFAKVAEAYGLTGITVTRDSEIAPALARAKKSDESVVIDVHVLEEANILPMFAAGAGHTEMFGGCVKVKGKLY
ncbi:MAG: biosynthetic-type acetolactate synthase large subunit [Candidatus Diapherotrites archaeon]|nr:biosynthetic-type acetolactate synthase large subunit [Candidatus Diapherotrites archaeon]